MPQEGNEGNENENGNKAGSGLKPMQKMTMHKVPGSPHELTTINLPNPINMQSIFEGKKKKKRIKYKIDEAFVLE